ESGRRSQPVDKAALFRQITERRSDRQQVIDAVEQLRLGKLLADTKEHSIAIGALGRRSAWTEALALLRELCGTRGLEPNAISFGAATSACAAGRWALAVTLLDEALYRGLEVGAVLVSALVSSCSNGQQWDRALK
ncbi:unnamed protein product, partial [Polarella glacialis]